MSRDRLRHNQFRGRGSCVIWPFGDAQRISYAFLSISLTQRSAYPLSTVESLEKEEDLHHRSRPPRMW